MHHNKPRPNRAKPPNSFIQHQQSIDKQSSSGIASASTDILIYVPDLPKNLPDHDIEQLIQTRIEKNQRMKLDYVKCYLKLGIAAIRLNNEEDKIHLVSTVQSMVLDPQHAINISFVNDIELDSYIVVDQKLPKMLSADEVAHHYARAYKTQGQPMCELVSIQFPNIFRIYPSTLDELIKVANSPCFKVENNFATVYPRADCSFFEDLPSNVDNEKLSSTIATQIDEDQLLSTSFYIQANKQTGTAVVIATKSMKTWIKQGYLTIDGRNISKKAKLAYRVLVSPVPRDFNLGRILNHKIFIRHVVSHKHIDNNLVIELDDIEIYNDCLELGAFRIDTITMNINPHNSVSDPDNSELDATNWYETAMLEIKPDITTIMSNHQHPIFRYKWNADNWIQQMKNAKKTNQRSNKYNLDLHLLRVTVMLNTIAILRKNKYAVDNDEVTLKLQRLQTIGYDHRAKLFPGKTIFQGDLKTPYKSTTVKVINEDCLVLYEKLVAEGHRPLLLNMANATSPGGGYRKGDGAQEENIFRRSDYSQSLDLEIADKERSEQLYCTSKCEFKRPTGYAGFYPMEEFGAIYTSGITVFRQTEANGYAYMKNPLYNVCAIAMAAYRDPPLNNKNMLENKLAINTHRKIENIFAIAYHHKHDCLVLSALGCGAFKNPPKHVALLFKSVIYQYAGYFDKIYFAIIDDHNTGNRINPDGNFRPFEKILDNLVLQPTKILPDNGVSGPYRILNKSADGQLTLSDVCISYLPPCQHGSKCRDTKDQKHNTSFSHPPMCSLSEMSSSCNQMDDEVHMFTFIHNTQCKHWGECGNTDAAHLTEYDHPEFCKDESRCIDNSREHLFAYRHLPICRNGPDCPESLKSDTDHNKSYRHCKTNCPDDNCCPYFHEKTHITETIHSFRSPCPFTPYQCSKFIQYLQSGTDKNLDKELETHCLKYSHVCPYGRQCTKTDNLHYQTSIHIARQLCPNGNKCTKLAQEEHLESFSHPNIQDIRLLCRDEGFKCKERFDVQHVKRYRHRKNHNQLTVAPSSNLNSSINFVRNQRHIIRTVNNYIEGAKWEKVKISKEILDWIRALQPVHRCGKVIFESILVHGHVMSRYYMKLLKKPKNVAKAVLQHSRIRLIFLQHNNPEVKANAFNLIKGLVEAEFAKTGADGITSLDPDHEQNINLAKKKLQPPLSDKDLKVIYDWTIKITQASIKLINTPMGIGYNVDEKMGTDKHIFSILGPHHGFYYGDIVIIFKQEIMRHPDTNFSNQAGTAFHSGRTYKTRNWLTDPVDENKRIEHFHFSKLHCSVPRYEYAAASDIIALTGMYNKSMNVNVEDIIEKWLSVDSHDVFESHLPQLIPLDYIDYVYMPQNLFDSLTHEAQQSARAVFKDNLILTNHVIDLSVVNPGGLVPLDSTRKPYLKYILNEITRKIKEKITTSSISRGIVITVPGSKFEEHIVLPITISQSYSLYRLDNSHAPNDPEFTYIYWQAMNGDMMLTISNEVIDTKKDQRNLPCLVCYVAKKPSTATEDYYEAYSYLNDGRPFQHQYNVHDAKFRAKSNVFYRGCNTDDFLTFCLKLSHRTGEVILSHAGANSIYNHQKISHRFNKSDLDLSRIDYIHVSGGDQDVPIRNLTIHHEKVAEFHPTFDQDFKIDTSKLIVKKQLVPVAYYGGEGPIDRPSRSEEPPESKPQERRKRSLVKRMKIFFYGSSKPKRSQSVPNNESFILKKSDSNPPPSPPTKRRHSNVSVSSLPSSDLPPCHDSVYCLQQNSKSHMERYSHPCRYNELCNRAADEPHLTHKRHDVPNCSAGRDCNKLTDPVHRAKYRHRNLPDYLLPCRFQQDCRDKKNAQHCQRYFHGEELPMFSRLTSF